ncbi:potassium channel family protein [Ornithinibacillus sp. JPR2-1]|uniref:potassium channel family protein n=1 Tax=Ornithinibacillus sp. JPR2-1 TaxID=2094019 RepID=UPI0031D354FE
MRILDRIVWLLLFIDVTVRFIHSTSKWSYIKSNPFDIIAIIPLDSIFHTARLVRLLRLIRLLSFSTKHFKVIQDILRTNSLDKVLITSVLILVTSTILVTNFEPNIESYADGLWWSIVTTSTVGYGDISPSTPIGRLTAVFLMIVGIGIIGMLSSSITTYFIRERKNTNPTIDYIKSELDRYDQLNLSEKERLVVILQDLNNQKNKEFGQF